MIKGLEEVSNAMSNSSDYDLRKESIRKMIDSLKELSKTKGDIEKEMQAINQSMDQLKKAKDKRLRGMELE